MNARNWGALFSALLLLNACDTNNVAGTNNETHTKGTLFQANGKVAVGARVRVFAANQGVDDSLPVAQTKVDADGQIALRLKAGYYSLLADDTGRTAIFIDSVLSDGDTVDFDNDTLRPTGTFTGHIQVQPMHSPAIAWVHLMRTNLFANVDSSGAFRIDGVPAGRMELVALTSLAEYTPTFREAQAISDSTVDVGTIDLVYNGLPLVTGIAATYDSLTGVVTVTWRDTAFARKSGYVIYRSQSGSSIGSGTVGDANDASFSDTVFGGFGATPSRYDSAEFDLTYRVAFRSQDLTEGPLWNKVSLHVKSPALAQRWKVDWRSIAFTHAPSSSIDTLAGGIALLSIADSIATLQIVNQDGSSSTTDFSVPPELHSGPVFWNGRVWIAKGFSVRRTEYGIFYGDTLETWRVFDSIRILSSPDAIHWDSSAVATSSDSSAVFRLTLSSHGMVVSGFHPWFASGVGVLMTLTKSRESTDGIRWEPVSSDRDFISGISSIDIWRPLYIPVRIQPTNGGEPWTVFPNKISKIIPGESADTTKSVLRIPGTVSLRTFPILLAIGQGSRINLAFPESPALWQRLSTPEAVESFCFWRGQLVVLGETGLHFATITPNP